VFELGLLAPDGETLRRATIAAETALQDLLRFRATTPIDLDGLPDGRYAVRVETVLEGEGPRPSDVAARTDLCILRSFVSRARSLPAVLDGSPDGRARAAELASRIPESRRDPLSHAILTGAIWQVERVYRGEPRVPGGDALRDLERAERIFGNLVADRDPLDGLSGRVTIGLPVAGDGAEPQTEVAVVSVDLGPAGSPAGVKPLVLVVGGAPAWTARADRPTSPRTVVPAWTLDQLRRAGFDADGRFHLAVLESPGRFPSASRVVVEATRHLRQILPVDPERVFWVGEREGAFAVSRAALAEPGAVAGLVLVAGSGLAASDLEALPGVRVLCVPAQGHPSTAALTHLARQGGDPARVHLSEGRGIAWPVALGLRTAAIESFVR
jgi:pimeloyl-ACP methyl ester carboxylesterase